MAQQPMKRRATKRIDPLKKVEEDIVHLADLRLQKKDIEQAIGDTQERINEAMAATGQKSASRDINGQRYQLTYVEGSRVVIDEEKLRKRLGAALWTKVSTRFLDKKKLEAYIASGEVKTSVVAACSDDIPNAPYTKVVKK